MVGFIQEASYSYAGRHLLIDLYGCEIDNKTPDDIKNVLENICIKIGATVLMSYAHEFDNGGSSGAIILAESHCTWHHWIDEQYIALDIFVCGNCQPQDAMDYLLKYFKPKQTKTNLQLRGVIKNS